MKNKNKWYVGYKSNKFHAFKSETEPTPQKFNFLYVVGPFVTKRGAKWAEKYGIGNPHFTDVFAAERIAKKQENDNRLAKETEEDILAGAR